MSSKEKNQPSLPKTLIFDIECTNLKADFGTILCIGYKWLGKSKVYVPSIMDYENWKDDVTNDKRLVSDFIEKLIEAEIWVTYNGKRFDIPYIQTKLLEHKLPFLPSTPHVDLYYTVRSNLSLSRKSLLNVTNFLELHSKSPVSGKEWKKAMVGDPQGINYVIQHCKDDVLALEESYLRLRPLARTHPVVRDLGHCRHCGSDKLTKQGIRIGKLLGKVIRIKCESCGSWDTRTPLQSELISL